MTGRDEVARSSTAKTVKSAQRAFEILEYLNARRPEASLSQISRDLRYPPSSASELLHCMCDLGYLTFDRETRHYRLTARVAVLGSWVMPSLFRHGNLLPLMDRINRDTGETVALGMQVGLLVHYIHVVQALRPQRVYVPFTFNSPLTRSAIGRLFLSTLPDNELKPLVRRLNADTPEDQRPNQRELLADLAQIKERGYALSADRYVAGRGMIAVLVPGQSQMVGLGIGAPSEVILEHETWFATVLLEAVSYWVARPDRDRDALA